MAVFLLILSLLMFVGLVVIHEFGHFIMARRNGVDVEEFGIGFPPAFWRRRIKSPKGDYDFTLNLLPLGGFVRMKGEHDSDTEKGSFGAAALGSKVKIMAAGVVMNFITAFVLLIISAWIGMPQIVDHQFTVASDSRQIRAEVTDYTIASVSQNSPAAKAGLKPGDRVTAVGREGKWQTVGPDGTIQDISQRFAGQTVDVRFERGGHAMTTTVTLNSAAVVDASKKTNDPVGYFGVTLKDNGTAPALRRSTWSAPIVAAGILVQFTALTFQGLGHALAGVGSIIAGFVTHNDAARTAGQTAASNQLSGPIGIFVVLKLFSAIGFPFVLFVIALISLSLAVMNILPIPALDGGRLWFTLLFRAFGKPLSETVEERINATGFIVLIGLIILISVVDVKRFF